MTKKNKLIFRLLANPQSLSYAELESILLFMGFGKSYGKGGHAKFKHATLPMMVIPVHNNDCKRIYKKEVARLIEKLINSNLWTPKAA